MKLKQLLYLLLFPLALTVHGQDQHVVDSIVRKLPQLSDKKKEPYYSELAWQYINGDIKKSHSYAEKALHIAEKFKDSIQLSDAYNTIAATHFRMGHFNKALYYNECALKIRRAQNDIRGMASSYSKIGLVYTDQGYFDQALKNQLMALDYFILAKDDAGEAQTYNNLGQIYYYQDNYKKAIHYSKKCREIYRKIDYPYGEASAMASLAMNYEQLKNYDSCIYYMGIAKNLFAEIEDLVDLAVSENALGRFYRLKGDNSKGLAHYQRAYSLSREINDPASHAQYGANLAAVYIDLGNLNEAYTLYMKGLEYAKENDLRMIIRQCYEGLSNYYEKSGNYQLSLDYRKKYDGINAAILDEEAQQKMLELDAKYRHTLDEKKILQQSQALAEQERKKAELQSANAQKDAQLHKNQLRAAIVIALVGLIALAWLWRLSRKKSEQKRLFTLALAEEQQRSFGKMIQAQEEERQRIARDLHDGIVQDIVSLKLDLKDVNDEALRGRIADKLDLTAGEVRAISHLMMPFSLKELGLLAAAGDLLARLLPAQGIAYSIDHSGDFQERLPEQLEITLYRMLQELINNALKHSKATHVSLTFARRPKQVTMIYEDNGIGLNEKDASGIGMESLQARSQLIAAKIEMESEAGQGLTVIVHAPIHPEEIQNP